MFPKSLIKRITWLLLTFSLVLALAPAPAAHGASSILVSATGTTSWPCGGTWASACALQTALTHATDGDEIWVGKGVYKPTTSTTDRTATFQLVGGVAVYGGFALTETLRTQRDPVVNIVVLSGDIDHNDVVDAHGVVATAANIHGANSYHVVTGATGATLDGVTITAGNADGSVDTNGGGMYNYVDRSPTLINVTFSGNAASYKGGGMYNGGSSPTLSNVTFSGNAAPGGYGGGMYNGDSSPTLSNVTFSGNAATYGGGMYNVRSSSTLSNVTFSGNAAPGGYGGGMASNNNSPTLTNITFSGNTAAQGGGMDNSSNSNPTLTNVTFSGNVATAYDGGGMFNYDSDPTLSNVTFSGNAAPKGYGGGMRNYHYSSPQVRNTLLWGDSGGEIYNTSHSMPTISDSVVQGGCPSDSTCTNVISADPLLASFGNYGGSMRTFALLPGSAAIAATSANCPATDQRDVARDSTCDIGAFESQGFTLGTLIGTPQSAIRNTAFAQPLGLSVTSAFSEPIAGGIISFIAPASGASLAGVTPFTKTIGASGAVSATVTANGLTGSYTVIASASGATSVNFALTNLGQTLYARFDGATSGACTTWASACTLQYALTHATARDEIWVGKGVYKPTTSTTDRTATFQLVNGAAVYGGFAMTETLRTQRDPAANVVVLSGDIDNNDVVDARGVVTTSMNLTGTNSYHVVTGATDAILDGVTITAGNTQGLYPSDIGGGMYNYGTSPTLSNVTFSGNAATFGGGIANVSSSPTLTSVTFSGNSATTSGGGMYNDYNSSPMLSNVTFSDNVATNNNGGGMFNQNSSSPTLSSVTFSGNAATYGGGMFNYSSSPALTNVTFSGNTAAQYGGGMYNHWYSGPTLTNVTFSGNSATSGSGGGMVNWDNSNPQVRNTLLWGDSGGEIYNANSTSTVSNSVVQGGCPSDSTCTNVISADPRLAPLGNYSGSTPTRALLPGSAAIDATSANCPTTDQRGVTRGSTCDIGAFESQGFTLGTLTGTPQSASINTAFAQPLGLSVTSAFSEPVAGGVISFTAHPAVNGASIAEMTPFTKTISASGAVSATVTANGLTGSYTVTASASGATSVNFVLANKLATTTTLTSAPNPSVFGQAVTFTATVTSSGGTPTGSITFTIDSTNLTVPLGANGQAVYVTQTLSLGNHPTSAAYSGDANFNVSSGILSGGQVVTDVPITSLTAVNSSPTRLTDITFFTATISTGSNITYQWNFGDGQTASGALSSHTYAAAGNYTAIVTATNGAGSVSTATPVTITNQRPVANAGAAQSVLVDAVVTLAGSGSADPDGHLPLTYRWTQSGGPSVTFTPNVSVTSFTAPSAPTVLTFTLHVTDAQGLPNLTGDSVVITVSDVAIANLTAANDSPMKIGHLTHFTATISAGSNVIYTWDFGNGQMSSGAFSSHTYAVAGNYTATITATNEAGSINATMLVTIEPVKLYLPLALKQ